MTKVPNKTKEAVESERTNQGSQFYLIWRRFRRHRLGNVGAIVVIIMALLAIFANFIAPYHYTEQFRKYSYAPPARIHFFDENGLSRPFVYKLVKEFDPQTYQQVYKEDKSEKYFLKFFVHGPEYKLLGLFRTDVHLFGLKEGAESKIFLFGTDKFGRSVFARVLQGARVSLLVGPYVILVSFPIAMFLGGLSGYYGGWVDMFLQRFFEVFMSVPRLPIWLALATILPAGWSAYKVFFGIVFIMALTGWAGMARILRGQFLSVREMDFVAAAKAAGASDKRVIWRHIMPNIVSYLLVNATLTIPGAIIGESTLSFLGVGIKEPMVSWGLMLSGAQSIANLELHPWLLISGPFIIITVLAFNFLGDAIRDAVDPFRVT